MNKTIRPKYVIGLLAIVIGAVATFDVSLVPVIRYLAMYLSIFIIAMLILMEVYLPLDDTPTLEKIKDES